MSRVTIGWLVLCGLLVHRRDRLGHAAMTDHTTSAGATAPSNGERTLAPDPQHAPADAPLPSCWIDARQGDCLALIPYMSTGDAVAIVSLYGPGHRTFGRRSLASVSVNVEQLRALVEQSAAMLAAIEARA